MNHNTSDLSNVSIQLDRSSNEPLYIQIYNRMAELINGGRLRSGDKLPAIRDIAKQLALNPGTVADAYRLLRQNRLAYSMVGSGTYLDRPPLAAGSINFADATPSPELFPVEDFKVALNEVLERDRGYAFQYQESQGFHPLRESISQYLMENGIEIPEESIQIISGAQQGIDVVSKALLDYGDSVFVESPTYTGAIAAFKSRRAKIVEIPLETDGPDIEYLTDCFKNHRPKFIYVMPDFQNPTGYSYSLTKRKALLELAERNNTLVVEDDQVKELRFLGDAKPSLVGLDKGNRVIYIKSFSKIFMPGLRLAFLMAPGEVYDRILEAKHTSDISTSSLIQRTFDLYLRKKLWKKHLVSMREAYEQRYVAVKESLDELMPGNVTWFPPEGGFNFWLTLPDGYSSESLYVEAAKEGVLFLSGSLFFPDQRLTQFFRLSFAAVDLLRIREGIEILARVTRNFLEDYKGAAFGAGGYISLL